MRVAGLQDMAVPQGDALEKLFELLRNTIAQQTQANGLTDNLALHLPEALAANDVPKHLGIMASAQATGAGLGRLGAWRKPASTKKAKFTSPGCSRW